ncbi:MAG: ATP-binding protein [Bacteroidota bacterium]
MREQETYKVRPAGRHILTIGRDLIQDSYAAVVELVKNAYDADSPDVKIEFRADPDISGYTIVIEDHGHGMSRDTVINKWMVPSTRDKLNRRRSPLGRVMQGRKGVGRYAASILGSDLMLETITPDGEKTTVFIEWGAFEDAEYLDDVDILIETIQASEPSGTRLSITGGSGFLNEWTQKQFDKLRFELKKLNSPVNTAIGNETEDDSFCISFSVLGFSEVDDAEENIEPYPLFELFDYRIAGKIGADGKGVLTYSTQKVRNATDEKIDFDNGKPTACGELFFDIRVYDRDKDSIDALISRGLRDETGNYVGKLQARQLLNEYNGIGVYRHGFRIRPLGDAAFDWVELNKRRVQNPSRFIGSDLAIGYVLIESEEESGLIEKSARDGLRENSAYNSLKGMTKRIISELEVRRFSYRYKAGLGRSDRNIDGKIRKLFSSDELEKKVRSSLLNSGVGKEAVSNIVELISKDAEDRSKVADDIRQTVAVYQGQATLGKIINVILHEGRRPLSYFRNQIPNIRYWYDSLKKTQDIAKIDKIMPIAEGLGNNAEFFVKLFSRLDPLAAGKRTDRKPELLKKMITDSFEVFEEDLKSNEIEIKVTGSDDFSLPSFKQDIYVIFTNLIDNSIYWMNEKKVSDRKIIIDIEAEEGSLLYIDYRDSGPGVEPHLIESEVIFEPQFSTKPSGTGLGLAIAGEASTRNDLELKAFEYEEGAWFRLQPKTEERI